jgi:hypothetical protein
MFINMKIVMNMDGHGDGQSHLHGHGCCHEHGQGQEHEE